MRIKGLIWALLIFTSIPFYGQSLKTYQLYNSKGKKVKFKKLIKSIEKSNIFFFGELHNNPICHWLQMETIRSISETNEVNLGFEMFERDNAEALEQYMTGKVDRKALDTLVRLWPNFETDYEPILNFAKENKIPSYATNIPRRYASALYRGGMGALDTLSDSEKAWIAPLPFPYDPNLKPYKAMLEMMGGHGGDNLPKAQAIKDATMAHFILQTWDKDSKYIHLNGSYHSDDFSSILWYLTEYGSSAKMLTLSSCIQENIGKLEEKNKNKADFILVIDSDVTTSY